MEKNKVAVVIAIILLSMIATNSYASITFKTSVESTENTLLEVLRTMDKASQYWSGQDVAKPIIEKLNRALSLIDESTQLALEGKASEAEISLNQAEILIEQAGNEADHVRVTSEQNAFQIKLIAWGLVPLASLTTTYITIRGLNWYSKHERRKILKTVIKRRVKEGE